MEELNILEKFDILTELQFPDYIYSIESVEEKIAFSNYISALSDRRILLLHEGSYNFPFVIAGLKESHIEIILKESNYYSKSLLLFKFLNPVDLKQISNFITELDRRGKTTENSARLKNILQYLRDNRFVI